MSDGETSAAVSAEAAASALAYLTEMSPDLRGGAILGAGGAVLAASGRPERWREDAAALLDAADRAGEEPVEQLHIATEQGEVFAARHGGLTALAVTDRFALASLLLFDMRAILLDLAQGGDGGEGLTNAA
jgi:predicted regulator of Ras-like GTPase activity (Roadblock/LC7/MglB family)